MPTIVMARRPTFVALGMGVLAAKTKNKPSLTRFLVIIASDIKKNDRPYELGETFIHEVSSTVKQGFDPRLLLMLWRTFLRKGTLLGKETPLV